MIVDVWTENAENRELRTLKYTNKTIRKSEKSP